MKTISFVLSILLTFAAFNKHVHAYEYCGYKWASVPVTYEINENGTPDASGEFTAIQNAFQTWEDVTTQSMDFTYGGTTSNSNAATYDGTNLVVWIESDWDSEFPSHSGDAAFASTFFVGSTILECDMTLNGDDYLWSTTGQSLRFDVQNIVTHEAGHWLCLDDLYGGGDTQKTMYGNSSTGETKKQTLEQDDMDGIRWIYFSPTTSGTLSSDEVWVQDVTLTGNATVPSDKNLTIRPGNTITSGGNYKLRVEGTLVANGTSSNKITFTRSGGTWYGIEYYNASSYSQISYCNIYNAQYGLRALNSYPTMTWSTVKYNTVGVRFENNSLSYGGALQGNVIAENSSDGVQCYQYSDPGIGANNLIRYNNFYGVYSDAGSVPNLGTYSSEGYNSIYYNGTEVWSAYSGTIYARYNWWGDANPTPNVSGNVDWSNYLTFDPNSGMGKPLAGDPSNKDSENRLTGESETDTLGMAEVDLSYKIFLGGEYDEALSRFEGIVGKYPDNFSSRRALVFVTRCLDRLNRRNESLSRVAQLVQNFTGKEVFGLAQSLAVGELVKSGQYAEAVAQSQEIVNNFPGTTLAKYALYDLGSIHWYRLKDEKAGESYFRQLIAAWPEDDLTISALATLGEWKPAQGKGSQPGFAGLESVPRSYELAQNFPNAFNPQTEILYQLPEPGRVSLKIYDLLGKEVRTLVEEFREAGYHHVIWDGRDNANRTVPSGVYLCKLTANGFVQTKKMALIK